MKSHWGPVLVVVSVLLMGFCGLAVVPPMWDRAHTLCPTPETESAFFKSYTPKPVIEQFREPKQPLGSGDNRGGQPGRKFVTHTAEFDYHFAMCSNKWTPLMNALRGNVRAQLLANGAKILHQSGDPHTGFRFDYQISKSTGTLTILPLTTEHPQRACPLPQGIVDVNASIEQTETWLPKEPSTIAAKFSDTMH